MNLILSIRPEAIFLIIIWVASIVVGVMCIIKFFQIAKNVNHMKDRIDDIARSVDKIKEKSVQV